MLKKAFNYNDALQEKGVLAKEKSKKWAKSLFDILKKNKSLAIGLGGLGLGIGGSYLLDDGHDKKDHGRKKVATVNAKLASSDLFLIPGKKTKLEKGKYFSPNRKYHYTAQGKYSFPGVVGDTNITKYEKNIGKKHDLAYYVSPENVEEYIKEYKKSIKSHSKNVFSKLVENKDRGFFEKLLGKNKYKSKLNSKELKAALEHPDFKKGHKNTLEFMEKHKDKGFTIKVGASLSNDEIIKAVKNTAKEVYGVPITKKTKLSDLKLDDLDVVEGTMKLEDKLNVGPLNEDALIYNRNKYNSKTLKDLVRYLKKQPQLSKATNDDKYLKTKIRSI